MPEHFKPKPLNRHRLKESMTLMDGIIELSDGNPGCVQCLADIAKISKSDAEILFSVLAVFDHCELYGTDIYRIWNDMFKRNTKRLLTFVLCVGNDLITDERCIELGKDQYREKNLTEAEGVMIDNMMNVVDLVLGIEDSETFSFSNNIFK